MFSGSSLKRLAIGLLAFIVICSTIILFINIFSGDAPAPDKSPAAAPMYVIKADGNLIGIYKGGAQTPEYYLETAASALPKTDRERLRIGIEVFTEEDLEKLCEALDS